MGQKEGYMLVSAVCPTKGQSRARYLPMLLECFHSQTWPEHERELHILDDGPAPLSVPYHPRVIYEYVGYHTYKTIGEKRNAINKKAHGDVIVHFDDDDWSAPPRIESQLNDLFSGPAQVTGYSDIFYYRERDGQLFKYRYKGLGAYASGTSLCYRREYWEKNPFPSQREGEDASFVFHAKGLRLLHSVDSCGMIVAVQHTENTSHPELGTMQFPGACRSAVPEAFFDAFRRLK